MTTGVFLFGGLKYFSYICIMNEIEIIGTFVKVRIGNELYVYFGGSLLYKRWINQGYGKVFHR